jgi:hypothetical protein
MQLEPGVPYFGDELLASQGGQQHANFAPIARLVLDAAKSPRVLEVGSWAGCSLIAWDKVFGGAARFTVVDAWSPGSFEWAAHRSKLHRVMKDAAASGEIIELFRHNVRAAGMEDRVDAIRGDSLTILPELPADSFDLVFIDGDHRYDWVRRDILNAQRLVRDRGIVSGDDLEVQLHDVCDWGGHKACLAAGRDYLEPLDGTPDGQPCPPGYHVGVTQAVGEIFGRVSCFGSIWVMRRAGDSWREV